MITVRIDCNNLKYFITKRYINKKQARWVEKLIKFDFKIKYRLRIINPTNDLSNKKTCFLILYNKLKLVWINIS
jgi:hypothetical protein